MKKLILLATLGACLASATPIKPAELMLTSFEARQAVCDAGAADGEKGVSHISAYQYGWPDASLSGAADGPYNICRHDAINLKQKIVPTPPTTALLLRIRVPTLSQANDVAVALSFQDDAENELLRLAPYIEDEGGGFTRTCATGSCVYTGFNAYIFATDMPAAQQELIRAATRVVVLVNRGQGVERVLLTEEMRGKLEL